MPNILTIADDLTGAAEMAGIGVDFGLPARLLCGEVDRSAANAAENVLIAVDLDTRRVSAFEAEPRIQEAMRGIDRATWIYKKTDSALRGHIALELAVMMEGLGKTRAILVAQNPSKERVVIAGEYRIRNVPLDMTDFRNDPEHPCWSARVVDLLGTDRCPVACINATDPLPGRGIIAGCAATAAEVETWARRVDENVLAGGGADFFAALLRARGHRYQQKVLPLEKAINLVICGSTSDYSREQVRRWREQHAPVCDMPKNLFEDLPGGGIEDWVEGVADHLNRQQCAVVAITHRIDGFRAERVRDQMARMVQQVIEQTAIPLMRRTGLPVHLFIEGGATAAAIAEALGWHAFAVDGNLAPGVVAMRPDAAPRVSLVIKPGSYPWPQSLLSQLAPLTTFTPLPR